MIFVARFPESCPGLRCATAVERFHPLASRIRSLTSTGPLARTLALAIKGWRPAGLIRSDSSSTVASAFSGDPSQHGFLVDCPRRCWPALGSLGSTTWKPGGIFNPPACTPICRRIELCRIEVRIGQRHDDICLGDVVLDQLVQLFDLLRVSRREVVCFRRYPRAGCTVDTHASRLRRSGTCGSVSSRRDAPTSTAEATAACSHAPARA